MSDLQRLLDGFDAGEFVRPYAGAMTLVDVVRAIAHVCGATGIALSDAARETADRLAPAEHVVFVIADGLGVDLLHAMPRGAWLCRNTRRVILAPYPSTTPVAMASIATGEYPARHAITGWWTHLPALNAPVTVFHHTRATDEVSLEDLGVTMRELCPAEPWIPRMTRDAALVMPAAIAASPFTRYMAGGAPRLPYATHEEAAARVAERIARAAGPTYTFWYTAVPDALAHEFGPNDARVHRALEDLDRALEGLAETLARGERSVASTRIVVSADHGHRAVSGARHLEVTADDALLPLLRCPPSGDVRTLFWHVRPGQGAAFEAAFAARFGAWFLLITVAEAEAEGLLGPDALTEETHRRVGDYVSIALGGEVLRYTGAPGRERYLAQRSHHSGLSAAEMHVPLVISGG
ncbi:MAG: hypothetical protein EXR64_05230 [Dehalococcoidia bacterium]|nr:hypothetical protein [Dehalococcoidia bacterium]